jgi:hypothetical protein
MSIALPPRRVFSMKPIRPAMVFAVWSAVSVNSAASFQDAATLRIFATSPNPRQWFHVDQRVQLFDGT